MGVHWIDTSIVSLRLGREQAGDRRARQPTSITLEHGDILVVNSTSYLDILYLMARWTPVFTRVYGDRVEVLSFWQAIRQCAEATPPTTAAAATRTNTLTLEELARKVKAQRRGPIIVQPEATTSNGRALLRFAPIFRHFDPALVGVSVRIATFRYPYHYFCPTFSFGNQWRHFFILCCQYHTPMTVKYLAPSKCPTTTPSSMSTSLSADKQHGDDDPLGEEIAVLMGQMSRLRRMQLSVHDKYEFLQFYEQRNDGRVRRR
ncbi:hypothetical protein SYNPS1DRAFT_28203 [Syncephalis pseudoplumigaleata]|uniref:Phospholipid/glycerol acyltransferase domain-containing protein n=1 Tax=Syncephalis pseudoplumigaleata TaxID=1712513 RepID=A0A4P9Z1A7_9FUNG|nr:hypothetical protein SYNPS1DRAFT_28203 [Syncephalis pseudoplumigaleata]|eukprot:RKP26085.1 hypothetical protein SYNPS1DRAFT_28203 [Syncephalis pseudoplumigaleata]